MTGLPINLGTIHFVGIGGIGMSGIAEILHNLGYQVQGSDQAENANVQRLRALGIKVMVGHDAAHIQDAQVVVTSSAVKADNVEVIAARERFAPIVRRAEMLSELMRLKWSVAVGGTHGKTTTTSMVAAMLDAAGLDPAGFDFRQIGAEAGTAPVGDQGHRASARDQFARQGFGREHMPAGTAGGQHHSAGFRAGHSISPVPTRRRVKASTMPMQRARASSDEPP